MLSDNEPKASVHVHINSEEQVRRLLASAAPVRQFIVTDLYEHLPHITVKGIQNAMWSLERKGKIKRVDDKGWKIVWATTRKISKPDMKSAENPLQPCYESLSKEGARDIVKKAVRERVIDRTRPGVLENLLTAMAAAEAEIRRLQLIERQYDAITSRPLSEILHDPRR